ncbi:MAG: hypothetical protein ISS81_04545 [Candidatus Marinimicrobia bacterium]|nr:hypothetical protein [Candidatus Neomarinimicrobiota bacterium]
MTAEDYKQQITVKIKDSINQWIDKLKEEHKELLLTKQWNIHFPKGFKPGNNIIPIVTASKRGKYLIGELLFYLPDNLELNMDSIELTLKNEPFDEKQVRVKTPVPLDEPLDVLNNIILGLNDFLGTLPMPAYSSNPVVRKSQNLFDNMQGTVVKPKTIPINGFANNINNGDIDTIRKQILQSDHLPEWFRTIGSHEIREQLLTKIAESLAHYRKQVGRAIDLQEFFDRYTEMLLKQDKLYHYCKYKSKPVSLDVSGHCTENYCSKKPYNAGCPHVTLRFGIK